MIIVAQRDAEVMKPEIMAIRTRYGHQQTN